MSRAPDDREPVVVEPSKRVFRFWAALSVVVIGFGTYTLLFDIDRRPFHPEVMVFFGSVLLVMMALQWGWRIVVTPDHIVATRRGRRVARAENRPIRAVGYSWMGRSLIFDDGTRIPFNELWDNADCLRASCAVMVDATSCRTPFRCCSTRAISGSGAHRSVSTRPGVEPLPESDPAPGGPHAHAGCTDGASPRRGGLPEGMSPSPRARPCASTGRRLLSAHPRASGGGG